MIDFNIKRFGKLLVWDLLSNKKKYIRYTTTAGILLLAIFLINFIRFTELKHIGDPVTYQTSIYEVYEALSIYVMLVLFFWQLGGSIRIFENTQTKQQRIAYFIQPASNLEKYLSRWLIYTLGFFLMFTVGLIVADIVQYLVAWFFLNGEQHSVTWICLHIFSEAHPRDPDHYWRAILFILILIAIQAYCTFCGTFFRKSAIATTVLLTYALCFLAGVFLMGLAKEFITNGWYIYLNDLNEGYYIIISCIVLTAFSAAAYFLSYKIFTRMQVVGRKWFNL
jgi:hypothetical protein